MTETIGKYVVSMGRPESKKLSKKLNFVVTPSMREDLEFLAKKEGVKISDIVRLAIANYLVENLPYGE